MKDVQEFKEKLVTIDPIEGTDNSGYGHFPFQMVSVSPTGSITMTALALGGDVAGCMEKFKESVSCGSNKVFISLDFPSGGDVEHDFVAVYSYDNSRAKVFDMFVIPYCSDTGFRYDEITPYSSNHLNRLYRQLMLLS